MKTNRGAMHRVGKNIRWTTIGVIAGLLCLSAIMGFAAPETISPVAGLVAADAVNVRSGPNVNFEVVIKLDKGASVLITGQSQDWYKISLPLGSKAYVHQKFVTLKRGMMGAIVGQKVNVRAGADTKFNVLGQLKADDSVAIIGQEGEWYKIYSFPGLSAWVSSEFIKKQGDAAAYQQAEQHYQQSFLQLEQVELFEEQERQKPASQQDRAALTGKYKELAQSYPESPVAQIASRRLSMLNQEPQTARTLVATPGPAAQPAPSVADIVSVEGKIMETGRFFNRRWTHKLVRDKKVLYYLKSDTLNLNDFVYYRVTVWGSTEELARSAVPLMHVTQVKPIVEH